METRKREAKSPNPCANSSRFYYALYGWTVKIFQTGHKRDLRFSDLYEPLEEHRSGLLGDMLTKTWDSYLKQGKPNLFKTILYTFRVQMCINFIATLILECVVKLTQPVLLGKLVSYYIPKQTDVTVESLYMYGFGILICSLLHIFITHPCAMSIVHLSMKYRIGCCSLIYRKALKLSKTAIGQTSVGQIINLVSNDVGRFDVATVLMNYIIIAPIQVIIMAVFMWYEMGVSGIIGVIFLLLVIPFQIFLGKQVSRLRTKTTKLTDSRLNLMNEFLLGIHIIKMYTWEKPFSKLLEKIRRTEMNTFKKTASIRAIVMSFGSFNARFAMFCSILTYVLLGNVITAEKVFVLTSFYSVSRNSLTVLFPQAITMLAEILVTTKRLETFLLYKETDINSFIYNMPSEDNLNDSTKEETKIPFLGNQNIKEMKLKWNVNDEMNEEESKQSLLNSNDSEEPSLSNNVMNLVEKKPMKHAIAFNSVCVKWTETQNEYTLNNINLKINPGSLIAIVGPVGSGKSTLFYTMLKEIAIHMGSMKISGKISYSSQEPWLFDSTISQNILFGAEKNRKRYKEVIEKCALKYDISLLSHGDETMIGEKGVALSGGQKARINLARAVYREADIYLLDDPLSSVDSHVANQLFQDCITNYLSGKTRLLITHQPQFLNQVDHIIMIKDGYLSAEGKFDYLQTTNIDFQNLLQSQIKNFSEDNKEEHINTEKTEHNLRNRFSSVKSAVIENEPVLNEETSKIGVVGGHIYKSYVFACGSILLPLVVLFLILATQFFASGTDYWISQWVNAEETKTINGYNIPSILNDSNNVIETTELPNFDIIQPNTSQFEDTIIESTTSYFNGTFEDEIQGYSREFYVATYSGFVFILVLLALARSFTFFMMGIKSSINLHKNMFNAISHATMRFFNTHPSGRILNRFSKDMGSIDEIIPIIMIEVVQSILQFIGIIVIIMIVNFWMIFPILIMITIFRLSRNYYLSTSRSLKRLESVARSPIFTHLSSSLQGMTTIRAFAAQKILIEEFNTHQDLHSSTWFMYLGTTRAFGLVLDLTSFLFITVVTLSFIFLGKDSLAGNVGLAITQTIGLTGMIQWGIRQSTELENFMICVERVLEYHDVEQDPPLETNCDNQLLPNWPMGRIMFRDVCLKYSPSGPNVLKNISFKVKPSEHIGIVGRSGSGKTSIINALFRMAFVEGVIEIDGIDITEIGVYKLRSKVSIIPQEPVLFSGTIRQNIDPFIEYSDELLWKALEQVDMKTLISEMPEGLQSVVTGGGSNFSIGQRQLICLARAIVEENKILVLDEATASVDPQTDILLQKSIRSNFSDCTLLTIAHRLQTVIDSDKIMVMDAGRIVEFDHPHVLLQNETGHLYKMMHKLKKDTCDGLMEIAKKNYESKQQR